MTMASKEAPKAARPAHLPEFGRIYRRYDGGLFRMAGVSYCGELDRWLVTVTDQRTGDVLSETCELFAEPTRWPDGKERARYVLLVALTGANACNG